MAAHKPRTEQAAGTSLLRRFFSQVANFEAAIYNHTNFTTVEMIFKESTTLPFLSLMCNIDISGENRVNFQSSWIFQIQYFKIMTKCARPAAGCPWAAVDTAVARVPGAQTPGCQLSTLPWQDPALTQNVHACFAFVLILFQYERNTK